MADNIKQQISDARKKLEELEKKVAEKAGGEYLVEPSYKRAYANIESPELKEKIAKTSSELYSAPAELRARYKDIYNPTDQERLVAMGQSTIEKKLAALKDIKEKREKLATDKGEFALAKYKAETARDETSLKSAQNIYERLTDEEKQTYDRARQSRQDALSLYKESPDLVSDLSELGVKNTIGNKIGGTVSWRHNNPLNIKYGNFATSYGATQGQQATDGGSFAVFPDEKTGMQAAMDLLRSRTYSSLNLEQAMRKWSGGGYGSNEIFNVLKYSPTWGNKRISHMTSKEMDELVGAMKTMEGWQEGREVEKGTINFSEEDKNKIQSYGLSQFSDEVQQMLLNRLTPTMLNEFVEDYKATVSQTNQRVDVKEFFDTWMKIWNEEQKGKAGQVTNYFQNKTE